MKSYKHLVKHFLNHGSRISVWDGEEWQVKKSQDESAIIDAIESVEEAELRIYDPDGNTVSWVLVIPFGLQDNETVADYTMSKPMLAWDELYTGKKVEL
jgi:hypothetical protein